MSAPFLSVIQQGMTRYGMSIMVTTANLSNLLSISIFSQRHHRKSSCSIYLIFAAISAIVSINWALIPGIKALNNPPDLFSQYLILCRLRGYILQVSNNLFRTFLVLACADRFAMSSSRVQIRSWATTKSCLTSSAGGYYRLAIHCFTYSHLGNNRKLKMFSIRWLRYILHYL